MRSKPTSTLGGFVWALQVWMWERIPVGRNFSLAPEEPWKYPFDGDEERYPTIAHTWANVQWTSIATMGRYKAYISELDMLTYEQVNALSNLLIFFHGWLSDLLLCRLIGGRTRYLGSSL